MKKLLLLPLAAVAMTAQAGDLTPQVLPDMLLSGISADGTWLVSSDPYNYDFAILNLATGETWGYGASYGSEELIGGGLGHLVSNTGVVVGNSLSDIDFDAPYYWENGEWHRLPMADNDFGAYPNAITPDGTIIAGSVSKHPMSVDAESTMTVPVIWTRNAQGGYDMYQQLPCPTKDWTGRTPQYVLVDDISADGTVIVGEIVDYAGFVHQPLAFVHDAQGNWQYRFIQPQLIKPEGIEFPTLGAEPREPKPEAYMTEEEYAEYELAIARFQSEPEPTYSDFMTPEAYNAYLAAFAAYEADWENNPYPSPYDFMTEEEIAEYDEAYNAYWSREYPQAADYMTPAEAEAYTAAHDEYEAAYAAWQVEFWAFDDVYNEVLSDPAIPVFSMNSAHISPSGIYAIYSAEQLVEDPNSWMGFSTVYVPYVFNLAADTWSALSEGVQDVLATQVTDQGWVLGATPSSSYSRNAVIAKGMDAPVIPLAEMLEAADPTLYDWVVENMTHEVPTFDYVWNDDLGNYDEVVTWSEQCRLGTPVATDDLSIIATWLYNDWDFEANSDYFSYLLPVNGDLTGIGAIAKAEGLRMVLGAKGHIGLIGKAAKLEVFDAEGRTVYSVDSPASSVATGLGTGFYLIRATAADGSVVVRKAAF